MIQTTWTPPIAGKALAIVPEWANELLLKVGGVNRYNQPNFRLIWSNSRMELVGGEFDKYLEGTEIWTGVQVLDPTPMPKYWTHPDRFIVEIWRPPEVYAVSEEQWYRITSEMHEGRWIPTLGPFPSQGDYEPSWILEDPKGNMLHPTHAVMEEIVGRVKAGIERYNAAQRHESLIKREEKKQAQEQALTEAIVKDVTSGFPGNSESVIAEPKHFEQESISELIITDPN